MNIEPDFSTTLRSIFVNKHKAVQRKTAKLIPLPTRMKAQMLSERIKNYDTETERTIETLKKLPFTAFGARSDDKQRPYLVGITDSIYTSFYQDPCIRYVCLGSYIVAIPVDSIMAGSLNQYHFIPKGRLHETHRHYHHTAGRTKHKSPLNYDARTCWGSVAALLLGAMDIVDVGSIFESCYVFLKSIEYYDSLCRPDFYEEIDRSTYATITGIHESYLIRIEAEKNKSIF